CWVRHLAALGPNVVDRVLDHIERRRFLVEPAREAPVPALVRLLNVDLHERTGKLLLLPGGRGLAGAQAHEKILPPRRLARVKRERLHDSIALVENAQDRNALGHRRHATLPGGGRRNAGNRGGGTLAPPPAP